MPWEKESPMEQKLEICKPADERPLYDGGVVRELRNIAQNGSQVEGGDEANAVAPGKRPLSSMSPTIVLKDGKPVLAIGAAGGPTIITQVLLGIVGTIDFGLDPAAALAQPRFHHQWVPDEIKIERKFPKAEREKLEAMGHELNDVSRFGAAQMIAMDPESGELTGASDPRVSGLAAGTE